MVGTTTFGRFDLAPSNDLGDIASVGEKINYGFSRSDGMVYFYNNTGMMQLFYGD